MAVRYDLTIEDHPRMSFPHRVHSRAAIFMPEFARNWQEPLHRYVTIPYFQNARFSPG
jgi:hypothetical protein